MQAEQSASDVKALKERVFRAMFALKRSKELQKTTTDMDNAQKELEMRALQLKNLMKRAWQGMVESRGEKLERIADEMAENLEASAKSMKVKLRVALLRAHRTGELREMRFELDELADVVSHTATREVSLHGQRWGLSSDSDSIRDASISRRYRGPSGTQSEADVSNSDVESHVGSVESPSREETGRLS